MHKESRNEASIHNEDLQGLSTHTSVTAANELAQEFYSQSGLNFL